MGSVGRSTQTVRDDKQDEGVVILCDSRLGDPMRPLVELSLCLRHKR